MASYSYNASNELTANSNGSYTYDANGNTLFDASGKSFTWDFENRLTQAVVPGTNGGTTTFRYDPFGRRIQKSGPLGTTNYLYDGANIVEEASSSGAATVDYSQSMMVDDPLAMESGSAISYYQVDGSGSATSLSGGSGSLAQTYNYDSYGRQTSSSGSILNPFQYTAREMDLETGLYYYRARYYDQTAGRFENEDPAKLAAGINMYQYSRNNPVLFVDPMGLSASNTGQPPPGLDPTIVCDGHGGIRPWIPGWYMALPHQFECIGDCMIKHELSHAVEAIMTNPQVCLGVVDGVQVRFSDSQNDMSEVYAWTIQLQCLDEKKNENPCPVCSKFINEEINWAQQQIPKYRLFWQVDRDLGQ